MRKLIVGFVLGSILGSASVVGAGFFYSPKTLLQARGTALGDAFVRGYIVGVHDLMAGWYPADQTRMGDLEDSVTTYLLRNSPGEGAGSYPAAFWVVGSLVETKRIVKEDAARILPATMLERIRQ